MVRLSVLALSVVATAALAGCSGGDGNASTSISFSGDNASGSIDDNGTVRIDTPVLKGDLKVPKLSVDSGDFDIDGVHLYPGSTITAMDVDAIGHDQGKVRVAFRSPASASTVRDWMKRKFDAAGFRLTADAAGLAGKTRDGDDFRMTLVDAGPGVATGTILTGN